MAKRRWIEFTDEYFAEPMSFWVHRHVDSDIWSEATQFDPPLPKPIPGEGFPHFYVEIEGFTFRFASLEELRECISVLGTKLLPTSSQLTRIRDTSAGPNSHWLSRLPGRILSWRRRQRIVQYLIESHDEFETVAGSR